MTDPWGSIAYAPNALGQPTQVSGYASNVTYHPNGAVAGYLLANGVVHSSSQTIDGKPKVLRDVGVVQDQYDYDANGNVTRIVDQQEGVSTRSMAYDGLDRLISAQGPWGAGSFAYDGLDNLRASVVGNRSLTHLYDANNRLSGLAGSQSIGFGYDGNGNITRRGGQTFVFDLGNRMTSAPGKSVSLLYDGHGRRSLNTLPDASWRLYAYTQDGKLRLSYNTREGGSTRYIYLGGVLIAELTPTATNFVHTDALGSPVATTNAAGALLSRTRYEPYGATSSGVTPPRMGFTGHVNDGDTGLVYMQQRYDDPIAGRFLSVDPVTTSFSNASHFNRYNYANNNPYRYLDPDRRSPCTGTRIASACGTGYNTAPIADVGAATRSAANNVIAQRLTSEINSAGRGAKILWGILVSAVSGDGANSEDKPSLLDPKGEQHVLDSDKTGSGHRSGTGKPGKSEFPSGWSDDRIKGEISDVATDPASSRSPGRGGREVVRGTRGGIDIEVIVEPNGRIVTGYPTNVPRNPR